MAWYSCPICYSHVDPVSVPMPFPEYQQSKRRSQSFPKTKLMMQRRRGCRNGFCDKLGRWWKLIKDCMGLIVASMATRYFWNAHYDARAMLCSFRVESVPWGNILLTQPFLPIVRSFCPVCLVCLIYLAAYIQRSYTPALFW